MTNRVEDLFWISMFVVLLVLFGVPAFRRFKPILAEKAKPLAEKARSTLSGTDSKWVAKRLLLAVAISGTLAIGYQYWLRPPDWLLQVAWIEPQIERQGLPHLTGCEYGHDFSDYESRGRFHRSWFIFCYPPDSHESTYSYLVEIEPIPPGYEQHAFIVALESPDPSISVSSGIDAMGELKKEVIASKHRWPNSGAGRGLSYHHPVQEWRR
jgi:hypothetical protein